MFFVTILICILLLQLIEVPLTFVVRLIDPREGAQGPGSSGGLGARWGLQSPLPFLHICFPLRPREVGTTTFILDTKKQSPRGTQVLPGPDVSEQEAWALGSLSPPFPESHPSCPAGPLGLSPLPLDRSFSY